MYKKIINVQHDKPSIYYYTILEWAKNTLCNYLNVKETFDFYFF